jgi:hypothetical protein
MGDRNSLRFHAAALWVLACLAACGSSGTSEPGPADGGPVATDGPADGGPVATDGAAAVSYQAVKPIFAKKCVPCHLPGGDGSPFHTLADSYATANDPSGACPGKKMGECTIVLVKRGFMPFERKCTGDPAQDTANSACLTAGEQKQLEDWIAGGLREK